MTREELNKKKVLLSLNNKKYEKVAHSGTENFLAYRKKVLEGRAKMDALKRQSEMFNVTEANDKHYNDLVNTGMLIHAQNPLYGQQRDNTKYYKREGDPGHYRYYYTKEEYDAAHKTPQSGMEKVQQMHNEKESNLQGMIKDGVYYEKGEDGKFHKTDKKWEDVRKQAIKEADDKIINAAKEGGYEAAKKAIFDDDRMLEMFGQFEGGFENHGWKLNDDGSITGMDEDDEKYFKDMEIWMRSFKDKTGIDIYKNKDFQKSVMDEIRNRYNMINNQTKERESKIEGTKKYAAPEGVGKNEETSKNIKKAADDAVKSVNETARKSDFNSKLNDTITNEGSDATADYIINNSPEWKEMVQAYKQAVNDGYIKMYRDGGKTVKDKGSKEIRDKFDPIFEKFEAVMQEAAKNPDFDRKGVEKLLNNELDNIIMEATENKYGVRDNTKKLAHEDFDPNTITTSEPLTPEQEYLNFKAKVEAGMKKQETIRHSMFIKSAKKQETPKPIKPVYDNNKFDFYENVKKFKEEHQNSLSHYGTKGQKWGTRHWQNDDGTFNEAGKERYFGKSSETKGSSGEVKENSKVKSKEEVEKEFQNSVRTFGADKNPFTDKDNIKKAKKLEKSFYNGKLINRDKIKEWLNSEENKAMVNKYNELFDGIYGEKSKKINDLFKDYDADEDKYVAKAGICDAVMHGDKLGDIGWEISWMLNDDGDQGSRDSRSYYLQEKGYSKKDINNLYNDQEEAYEAAGAIANLTTKYNPVIYNMSDNTKININNELAYNYNKTHGYVHAKISGAADGMELDKNNISAANDIANKLSPSCGGVKSNGWYYVNQAINNLPNLKDKSYKELTQADWDKINAEINSLKK